MSRLFLILLGTVLIGVWAEARSPGEHVTTRYASQANNRLPKSVFPLHYDLELQPYIYGTTSSAFFFQGRVSILLKCRKTTSQIVLHMDSLNISDSDISVKRENSQEELFRDSVFEDQHQFLRLYLNKSLNAKMTYLLEFRHFFGPLRRDGEGLFLSQYEDRGNTVYLVSSRMGPVYARKVFPCFDEPQRKATFKVNLVRRKATARNYMSLSNTALVSSTDRLDEQGVGWVVDSFNITPRMSTYRLTFVLSDFTYLEGTPTSEPSVTYRTYARPNAIGSAEKAHQLGLKVFDWLNRRFKPNYGQVLSKLDNIALPVTVSEGNWGLITYGEDILYQRGVTSAYYELKMISVVSHNMAQMWFGNYVNAKQWTWVWLEEAVASWCGLYAIEQINPGWRMTENWISLNLYTTLEKDALVWSKPLNAERNSPKTIPDVFKDKKGTAIIRMIHFIMGTTNFIDGLNLYLENRMYRLAKPSHLFSALDQIMQNQTFGVKNITVYMDSWVSQTGYPVVTVERTVSGYRLSQERFLFDPSGDNGELWYIPIVYATSEDTNMKKSRNDICWLKTFNLMEIEVSNKTSWILINPDQVAYCRVSYDYNTWQALIDQLNRDPSVIPAINRGQIINDAWNLAKSTYTGSSYTMNVSVALSTLDFLQKETDLAPWAAFTREIDYMTLMLAKKAIFPEFRTKIRSLLVNPFKTLTLNFDPDMPPTDASVRTLIVEYGCAHGVMGCVNEAQRLFTKWRTTGTNGINPNLRFAYYCTAVAEGDGADWDFVHDTFMSSKDAQERQRLRRALSCSKNTTNLQRLLEMTLDPMKISSEEQRSTIKDVSVNPVGGDLAYNFYLNNLNSVKRKFFSQVAASFNTQANLLQLRNLEQDVQLAVIRPEVLKAIDQTHMNIAWIERNYELIRNWVTSK